MSMHTTEAILASIRSHGADAYPEEGCGFLLGTVENGQNHVHRIRRVANRHPENRDRRYQITPDDYREAEEHAKAQDLDIVGFYHSHPDHPARPSQTDLAEATFPGYTYVIVSVKGGAPDELTAWSLAPDRSQFNDEDVTLTTTV